MKAQIDLEPELTTPLMLCTPDGSLNPSAVGWTRHPLHTCNLSGHALRKKRWNYWCITSPEVLFSVTLSNLDYMGLAFVYYLDLESRSFSEKTVMSLFGKGCELPETVGGWVRFENSDLSLNINDTGCGIHLQSSSPELGGVPYSAELNISRPEGHETLNVVIPWSPQRFQFTSKQNCLPVSGNLKIGPRTYTFNPESAFACLDYGRGIWKYECFWNWGSFSGICGGHTLGGNFGAGWTDGSGMTENGLCIDGRLFKLSENVQFIYDPHEYMKPWILRSTRSDQVELTFTPIFERVARTEMVVLRSEVHQMIGHYSGVLRTPAGEEIRVENLLGWAEDHQARW